MYNINFLCIIFIYKYNINNIELTDECPSKDMWDGLRLEETKVGQSASINCKIPLLGF